MNNKRLTKAMLVVAAISAPACAQAFAAVQFFSSDYGSPGSPLGIGGSQTLSLGKFDPSLGTLTSATLKLVSHATVESLVINASPAAQNYTDATASIPIHATALGGLTLAVNPTAGPFSGIASGPQFHITEAGSAAVDSTAMASVAAPDLILYQGGGGQTFNLTVSVLPGVYSGMAFSPLFFGGDGTSYGTVSVEYNYSAVPEVGTFFAGAVAACLAGFGMIRRRRPIVG